MMAAWFVLAVAAGCCSGGACVAGLLPTAEGGARGTGEGGGYGADAISAGPCVCEPVAEADIFFSEERAVSEATLKTPDGFRRYWTQRSLYIGFSQVWRTPAALLVAFPDGPPADVYPAAEWLGEVDFAEVEDLAELKSLSDRAELEYELEIEVLRAEFLRANCADVANAGERARWCIEFERELCKADLYWLAKHVLEFEDMSMHLHYFMCGLVNRLDTGEHALFEFPRDSFKSTIFGISKTVQLVLNDPNVTVLYLSGSLDNAKKKTNEIRLQFTKNEVLLHLFPEFRAPSKSQEGSEGEWRAPCATNFRGEPTIKANGITSRLASKHVDVIVCDDIWDEKSVTTPDVMAKTRKGFKNAEFLFKRTSMRVMLVIGTRFAQDDLTLDIAGDGTEKFPGERLFKGHCHIVSGMLPNGRSLFPEGFTLDWMMDYCNGGGTDTDRSDGGLYDFSCQIMLNPSMADKGFDPSWFRYLSWTEIRQGKEAGLLDYDCILLTDAAGSDNRGSDRDAILVVCRDSFGRKTVVLSECRQRAPAAFVSRVFGIFDEFRCKGGLVVQKAAIDTVVRSFIDEENVRRAAEGRAVMPVLPYSLQRQDKDERITHALQPLLQRGELYFDPDMPECRELVAELQNHPASLEKHRIDALSELGDPRVRACPSFREAPAAPEPYVPESRSEVLSMQDEFRRQMMAKVLARAEAEDEDEEDWA